MKLGRLNHVGVATPDIETAIAFWRETMGATAITEPFDMPEQGVRVCFVDTPDGGTQVELLAPLSESSPVAAFLQRNPLGGQHHLAFEVPDIHAAHQEFTAGGKRILGPIRQARKVLFHLGIGEQTLLQQSLAHSHIELQRFRNRHDRSVAIAAWARAPISARPARESGALS